MTADRRKRHLKILELISTRPIRTQDDLAEALAMEGWAVTQSSVSRDIASLRLAKVDGIYVRPAAAIQKVRDQDELRIAEGVLTVDLAGDAIVVLHTPPGEANRVGAALDRLSWSEIVGTIAGDDTIFLAVQDRKAQREIVRRLREIAAPA